MRVKHGCSSYTIGLVNDAPAYASVSYLTDVSLGVVCRLRRIQSSRYEIGLQMQGTAASETLYTSLVRRKLKPISRKLTLS
jgi:hypothetical protein